MRERVVYILGAGFSAPLGLPVMSNFLIRSKDLYAANPTRFAHFEGVFREIARMAQAKNYLDVDLFNIEHILSILDMEDFAVGTNHRETFVSYLADTIEALTPVPPPKTGHPGNWEDYLFTDSYEVRSYCTWLAGLLGLSFRTTSATGEFDFADPPSPSSDYSIISLNYDLVLENCLELINRQYIPNKDVRFRGTIEGDGMPLAKIHGSVKPLTIVPPTWQKTANKAVLDAWRLAVHLLTDANQIRIMGFSSPETDGYVKYLLSLGAMRASHLKYIDVFCLDPDGTVERRYRQFISYRGFRFKSGDIKNYVASYGQLRTERDVGEWHGFRRVQFGAIDSHHQRMME